MPVFDADLMRNSRLQLDQLLRSGPWCDYATVERSPRDTSHRPLLSSHRGHVPEGPGVVCLEGTVLTLG